MNLTKVDFIHFLECAKSFWLMKREPDSYPYVAFSSFMKKIVSEGYDVERLVQKHFNSFEGKKVEFQRVFKTKSGLYARTDMIEKKPDGKCFLFEIKSSTSVKTSAAYNHIKDACYQKIVAERAGQKIDRVFIIHLNSEYTRSGEIDTELLLSVVDVTEDVMSIFEETSAEIDNALNLLNKNKINREGCSCLYKSRAHHCDAFDYFNPNIPTPSIYSLPRLSDSKRKDLVNAGIFSLMDIPISYELSNTQKCVLKAAHEMQPQVNQFAIKTLLDKYQFPLYFFDYETFSSAIPIIDGIGPHKQFPVQYSLHVLEKNGNLIHKEYLEREARLPDHLVNRMQQDIGPHGSIISWHASFEKSQNNEMALIFPDCAKFLKDMNDRMVDLEDIFKLNYVDARFEGSTSIKKVLPVICQQLSYKELDIQDGTSAMEAWKRMINLKNDEALETAKSLLKYCELDTFAMVEIYRFLKLLSPD